MVNNSLPLLKHKPGQPSAAASRKAQVIDRVVMTLSRNGSRGDVVTVQGGKVDISTLDPQIDLTGEDGCKLKGTKDILDKRKQGAALKSHVSFQSSSAVKTMFI